MSKSISTILLILSPLVAGAGELPVPWLVVAKTPVAPRIDGQIEADEWRYASAVSGFVTLGSPDLAPEQTVVYVTYDGGNLYIAYKCFSEGGRPNAVKVERDGSVWGGDSIELSIAPPWMKPGQYYHFIGNYHGSIFDMVKLDAKKKRGFDASWNGNWAFENYTWEGVWAAEIAIPLRDLRADQPRGLWRMNFGRTCGKYTSWSSTGKGYHNARRFGRVRFVDSSATPQLLCVGRLDRGELALSVRVHNPSKGLVRGGIAAVLMPGKLIGTSDRDALRATAKPLTQGIQVPVESVRDFKVTSELTDRELDVLQATIQIGGQRLYRAAIPFSLKAIRYVELIPLPSEDRLLARIDLRRLRDIEAVDVRCVMKDADGKQAGGFSWQGLKVGAVHIREESVARLPLGRLHCDVSLVRPGSTTPVCTERVNYERRAMPEWYRIGRTLGRRDRVLAPWTPLRLEDDSIHAWGRRYVLGSSLLFERIRSREVDILAEGMALIGSVEDETHTARLRNRKILSAKRHAVHWTAEGLLGSAPVQANCLIEFDGMAKVEMTVSPQEGSPISSLYLSIPLRAKVSDYCHYSTCYYDTAYSGYLPKPGLHLPFVPYLWLGDLSRGLMWFAEGPIGWRTGEKPIRVERSANTNVLRITFVDAEHQLDAPRKFVFGLQATPVKPLPKGWRGLTLGGRLTDFIEWNNDRNGAIAWRMRLPDEGTNRRREWVDRQGVKHQAGFTTPLKLNEDALKQAVSRDHSMGTKVALYEYLAAATVGRTTGFDRYRRTWRTAPCKQLSFGIKGKVAGSCLASSYQELLLYGIKHLVERTDIDGIYFDSGGGPSKCRNALHGHGWLTETGRRHVQYPIFAARQFNKRLALMLAELRGDRDYIIWNHISQNIALPMLSFSTAFLDGESPFQTVRDGGPNLTEIVSLDYLRVQATGGNWGIVPTWLIYRRFGDPDVLRATLAMLLPHGTVMNATGGVASTPADRELVRSVWRAYTAFGLSDADFHGYWENRDWLTITPPHEKLICSLYVNGPRFLLVLSNVSKQPFDAKVKLSDRVVSQLTHGRATDTLGRAPVALVAGVLSATVEAENFRLIRVE